MLPSRSSEGSVIVQSQSPYENVDPVTQMWLDQLKNLWAVCKKSDATKEFLHNFFSASKNAYVTVLQAMLNSGDFYTGKENSLAYFIMACFSTWSQNTPNSNGTLLDKNIKVDAFKVVLQQRSQGLVNLVIKNFCMVEDKLLFVEPIRELVAQAKYKEACQCTLSLNLCDQFTINDFVIPLVLQDKYAVAEKFIKKDKKYAIELVKFLDNLVGSNGIKTDMHNRLRELNFKGVNILRLDPKPMFTLIQRVVREFELDFEICPNYMKRSARGVIHYLMKRRFQEHSIGDESWAEMILEGVGSFKDLQEMVMNSVLDFGLPKEALMWAEKFEIPEERWPPALKMLKYGVKPDSSPIENWDDDVKKSKYWYSSAISHLVKSKENESVSGESSEENWDDARESVRKNRDQFESTALDGLEKTPNNFLESESSDENWYDARERLKPNKVDDHSKFHRLSLDRSRIHIINCDVDFLKCINKISKEEFLGIDAEWKPSCGLRKTRLSLLQVATFTDVYLLDLYDTCLRWWEDFYDEIFRNPKIIKLGFAMDGDLKLLEETLTPSRNYFDDYDEPSYFAREEDEQWSTLDLMLLWKILVEKFNFQFPFPRPKSSPPSWTLSTLVELCLGKKLDKSDQFSNWENRPLRFSQRIYAALDAYCLLEIMTVLVNECKKQNIALMDIIADIFNGSVKNKSVSFEKPLLTDNAFPEPPSLLEFKFVVQYELNKLIPEFRVRGIDAVACDQNPHPVLEVEMSNHPKAVFVTKMSPLSRTLRKKYSKYNKFCCVSSTDSIEEQLENIRTSVNAVWPDKKTPSRCLECNSNEFARYFREEWEEALKLRDKGNLRTRYNRLESKANKLMFSDVFLRELQIISTTTIPFIDLCLRCHNFYYDKKHVMKYDRLLVWKASETTKKLEKSEYSKEGD